MTRRLTQWRHAVRADAIIRDLVRLGLDLERAAPVEEREAIRAAFEDAGAALTRATMRAEMVSR